MYFGTYSDIVVDAIAMAVAAYTDGPLPSGSEWQVLGVDDLPGLEANDFDGIYFDGSELIGAGPAQAVVTFNSLTGKLFVAFRGTDSGFDVLNFPDLFIGDTYINAFAELLEGVRAYAQANGILSRDIVFSGHSLGAGAANNLRNVSDTRFDGFFLDSQYVTIATPFVSDRPDILNIGFENDAIFHVDSGETFNRTDNLLLFDDGFADDSFPGLNFSILDPGDITAHSKFIHLEVIKRILETPFYDTLTRDSILIIDNTDAEVRDRNTASTLGDVVTDHANLGAFYIGQDLIRASDMTVIQRGDDRLTGNDAADQFFGAGGNDIIRGNGGDDIIYGGAGDDTAVFSGASTDYAFLNNADGSITITHVAGDMSDGADTLYDVETARFSDGLIYLDGDILSVGAFDVIFAQDLTGSFSGDLPNMVNAADEITASLQNQFTDITFAVTSFLDEGESYVFRVDSNVSTNAASVVQTYATLSAAGGGDIPEAQLTALRRIADGEGLTLRTDSTRIIILATDAPYQPYEDLAELRLALETSNTVPIFAVTSSQRSTYEALVETLGRGAVVTITSNSENFADALRAAIASLTGELSILGDELDNMIVGDDLLNDGIYGTLGDDTLSGLGGDDTLDGGAGDDGLFGGFGDDSLIGGSGDDELFGDLDEAPLPDSSRPLAAENPSDPLMAEADVAAGNDDLDGGTGNDFLYGGGGNDNLTGGLGADHLYGEAGDDVLVGDIVVASSDDVFEPAISLGSGQYVRPDDADNSTLETAVSISDLFSLSADEDIFESETVPHVSITGTGDGALHYFSFTVNSDTTRVTLDIDYADRSGGEFDSFIALYSASGALLAQDDDSATSDGESGSTSSLDSFLTYTLLAPGTYVIAVGAYPDLSALPTGGTYELQVSIEGELTPLEDDGPGSPSDDISYDDILDGGDGNDSLDGGIGNDILIGGLGNDIIIGGLGADTASFATAAVGVTIDLGRSNAQDTGQGLDTLRQIENLIGSDFSDLLAGDAGANTLSGGAEDDLLFGDTLAALSTDGIEAQVYRAYAAVFGRAPDANGFTIFIGEVRAERLSQAAIITEFVASEEFQLTYGELDNAGFVEALFANVLPGNTDPAGRTNFVNALAAGTLDRTGVVLELANTPEFVNRIAPDTAAFATNVIIHPAEGQVFRIYQAVFDRAPDAGGFTAFVNQLQAGVTTVEAITAEFVGSEEFQLTYGDLTDAQFVEALFTNVLPGNEDAAGRAAFTAALSDGSLTRAAMVAEFAESQELRNRTDATAESFVQSVYADATDTLDGGTGEDVIYGGRGADRFVYDVTMDGADLVMDFTAGTDMLALSGSVAFDSFAEIIEVATQIGQDTVLTFSGENSLTLVGVTLSDLTADDFDFGTTTRAAGKPADVPVSEVPEGQDISTETLDALTALLLTREEPAWVIDALI